MCVCDTSFEARFLSSQVVVDGGGSQQVGRFRVGGVGPLKKKRKHLKCALLLKTLGHQCRLVLGSKWQQIDSQEARQQ